MPDAEKIRIHEHNLNEILKEEFIEKIEGKVGEGEILPVAVVLAHEYTEYDEKMGELLSLNHNNPEEIENKILHIESINTKLVDIVKRIFMGE